MSAIRGRFDERLTNLGYRVLRMGSLVDEAIELALRSLIERDSAIARRVIDNDKVINDLRYAIEEQCYTLIATQQPLASDLRRVMATISIVTNMERMADDAAGIAVLARRLNKEAELKPLIDLPRMAVIARSMLRRSLEGYMAADSELAYQVAQALQEFAWNWIKQEEQRQRQRQHTPKSPLKRGVRPETPLLRGDLGVCCFCR